MAKYLLAYHGGGGMPESPEAQAQVMQAWGAWYASFDGTIVDPGDPCARAVTISSDGTVGAETTPSLSGYTVIETESLDKAVAFARTCPVLAGGASIEVVETFPAM